MTRQLILLASAFTYRTRAFEQAAEKLGIPTVRGTDIPPPMVGKVEVPLQIDYRDAPRSVRRIERYAGQHPVGAILGLDDSGTLIAAAASERLGLPYNSPESARAAGDKRLMRTRFAAAGVPSPAFSHHTLDEDPRELAAGLRYPCVIKPTSLSGSRGVMRADDPQDFVQRVQRLGDILATQGCDDFLVEDFIPGVEVALEGLLDNGELHTLALFDKPDPLDGPFFEETLYVTPSRLPAPVQDAVRRTAAQAAAALGLRHGPVHTELRVDLSGTARKKNGPAVQPVMVEMAGRSMGGSCSRSLHFDLDMSLEELIVRQAMGPPYRLDDLRSVLDDQRASGVMMIPIPESGILAGCHGVELAREVPGIEEVEISAPLNHSIQALPEGDSYLGFIFARAGTPQQVETALRQAHAFLRFDIMPEIRLTPALR